MKAVTSTLVMDYQPQEDCLNSVNRVSVPIGLLFVFIICTKPSGGMQHRLGTNPVHFGRAFFNIFINFSGNIVQKCVGLCDLC